MNDVYTDIAERTGGDVLIGVVGPVRSGKSTFVNKFMEKLVIPNITGKSKKQIASDELPQSAAGKTVMTTEPKFVPGEAVTVKLDKAQARVRLIDSVGYMIDGAVGLEEDGRPRLVKTPWQEEEMTFEKASEYGTKKVISEHSTIGFVITADGSFTDIERAAYKKAEERVVGELKALNKPFIVVFNTTEPTNESVKKECEELEKAYGVAVVPTDVTKLDEKSLAGLFERLLLEFPLRVVNFELPKWIQALKGDEEIVKKTFDLVAASVSDAKKMSAYKSIERNFSKNEYFDEAYDVSIDTGNGSVKFSFTARPDVFYKVLENECGESVTNEYDLLNYVRRSKTAKDGYGRIKSALESTAETGYGIVPAEFDLSAVEKPRVVKKNGQYCVKIGVGAESMHIINVKVHTDVEVVSGSKEQCDKFIGTLNEGGAGLETEVFGKSVSAILEENVVGRSVSLCDTVKQRLRRTANKAVNEKKNNLICILI
ncbi:MAG: stage IV sporulation protein A [Clostridia bacterium]|nr:stage IV sporulation protein A [Clostridia bacterium]